MLATSTVTLFSIYSREIDNTSILLPFGFFYCEICIVVVPTLRHGGETIARNYALARRVVYSGVPDHMRDIET